MRTNSLAIYLQNKAARDIVVVQHLALGQDLLIPPCKILFLGHVDSNKGGIGLLLRGLGRRLLCLVLGEAFVDFLLVLIRGLLGHLRGLLCGTLGHLALGGFLIGGGLAAIRQGLDSAGVRRDRGVGGVLRSHSGPNSWERRSELGGGGGSEAEKSNEAPRAEEVGWRSASPPCPGRTFRLPRVQHTLSPAQPLFSPVNLLSPIMAGIFEQPRNADTLCELPVADGGWNLY